MTKSNVTTPNKMTGISASRAAMWRASMRQAVANRMFVNTIGQTSTSFTVLRVAVMFSLICSQM